MNKNGFTLVELLVTIVIIAVIMGIILPSAINVSRNNQTRVYHEYEKMMEEYALVNKYKGAETISLDDLDDLKKVIKDCSGYVSLVSDSPLQYKAYIICGEKYNTDGYTS